MTKKIQKFGEIALHHWLL